MQTSWILSKNDVFANSVVIISDLMVSLRDSRWQDLVKYSLEALVISIGARYIILVSQRELLENAVSTDHANTCSDTENDKS